MLVALGTVALALTLAMRGAARTATESGLGLALGGLVLAVRLQGPVASPGDGPVSLTLLEAPRARATHCRLLAYVHGAAPGRTSLRAPIDACAWLPGQTGLARIRSLPPRPRTNPGGRDPARRAARRSVHHLGVVEAVGMVPIGGPPASPAAALERFRRRLGEAVDPRSAQTRAGALLRALVTGDRSRLTAELRRPFERSGTAHLLAVSGLHVGWISAVARFGLETLLLRLPWLGVVRVARPLALVVGCTLGAAYAGMTGFGVPAVRAAAMAFAGTVAVLGGRAGASTNALALAALLVLATDPAALFEPPLWLSFLAVSGILLWRPTGGFQGRLIGCTLGAGLATAPVLALLGAPLPGMGLVANALAVPWFGVLVIPSGVVSGLAGSLFPDVGGWLRPVPLVIAELGIRLVEACQGSDLLEGATLPVARAAALTAAGFGLRLLWLGQPRPALLVAGGGGCVCLAVWVTAPPPLLPGEASLGFLDVGHGDAVLVRSDGGAWLVDSGPRIEGFDAGRHVVLPALRAQGVRRLDVLLLSHADRDHTGGALAVLDALPIGELWLPVPTLRAPALRSIRVLAAQRGVSVRAVAAGEHARLGAFEIRVLGPPRGAQPSRSNDASIVLEVRGAHGCALLPADASRDTERALALGLRPCAVLKLGHHGSRSSSDPALLAAVRPWVAIASAGRRAGRPLPHPDVRRRLAAAQVSLFETWRFGAVRVDFGPRGLVVHPWRSEPLRLAADLPY